MKELGQFYGCDNPKLSCLALLVWPWLGQTSYLVPGENDVLQKQTHQPNHQPIQDYCAICEIRFILPCPCKLMGQDRSPLLEPSFCLVYLNCFILLENVSLFYFVCVQKLLFIILYFLLDTLWWR